MKQPKQETNIKTQILKTKRQIKNLERILNLTHKTHFKSIKMLNLKICIKLKHLSDLQSDLDKQRRNSKVVLSEKMETLFLIAKGLKPKLSKKIDSLLLK